MNNGGESGRTRRSSYCNYLTRENRIPFQLHDYQSTNPVHDTRISLQKNA